MVKPHRKRASAAKNQSQREPEARRAAPAPEPVEFFVGHIDDQEEWIMNEAGATNTHYCFYPTDHYLESREEFQNLIEHPLVWPILDEKKKVGLPYNDYTFNIPHAYVIISGIHFDIVTFRITNLEQRRLHIVWPLMEKEKPEKKKSVTFDMEKFQNSLQKHKNLAPDIKDLVTQLADYSAAENKEKVELQEQMKKLVIKNRTLTNSFNIYKNQNTSKRAKLLDELRKEMREEMKKEMEELRAEMARELEQVYARMAAPPAVAQDVMFAPPDDAPQYAIL